MDLGLHNGLPVLFPHRFAGPNLGVVPLGLHVMAIQGQHHADREMITSCDQYCGPRVQHQKHRVGR